MFKTVKLGEHNDERGSLVENTLPEIMSDSKHFFVSKSKPEVIRGNHYHLRKSEWFYVLQGKCIFFVEDIKTKRRQEITVDGSDSIAVNIGPNKSHAFKNIGNDEMILLALVNEIFDKDDPDTYPYQVI